MATLREIIERYERPDLYCKHGHERAVHERTYPRPNGGEPYRKCAECQRERQRVDRRVRPGSQSDAPAHPDEILWAEFCATIGDRIEAMRADAPPLCVACERMARPTETRRCSRCKQIKVLGEAFSHDRSKPHGYRYVCKACSVADNKRSNLERKRRQLRAVLGRAS